MHLLGVDTSRFAVDDADSFRRVGIECVVIDALVPDTWANSQTCLGQLLIVARQLEFNLSQVTIGVEGHALGGVKPGRIVMNSELDLSRSAGDLDDSVA